MLFDEFSARFQLFGDTVNTTSRMESTGVKNKIHTSIDTANLLIAAGKGQWLSKREDDVLVKGKGIMNTFWVNLNQSKRTTSVTSSEASASGNGDLHIATVSNTHLTNYDNTKKAALLDSKFRLIKWNTDTLTDILKQIAVYRTACGVISDAEQMIQALEIELKNGVRARDEMVEVVCLPGYETKTAINKVNQEDIVLDERVQEELFSFVSTIASMYRGKFMLQWFIKVK
jgi:hypothetical protein